MKFPVDWALISLYVKAKQRTEKAKTVCKKPEIAAAIKEKEKANEELKTIKKEIAGRFPAITRAVKSILTICVNWKHVDTTYDYPEVDVRLRDDAIQNATATTDDEERKTAKKIIKEIKAA